MEDDSFYGFERHHHTISGYGDSAYNSFDYKDRKYCDFERKGYAGYTISDLSRWELLQVKRWIKKQPEYIYLSQLDLFETTDNGGYVDNSVCLWFSRPDRIKEFVAFLDLLPNREYSVDFDETNSDAMAAFTKDELKSNRRLVLRNKTDDTWDRRMTVTFDDAIDAMAFKLRWI